MNKTNQYEIEGAEPYIELFEALRNRVGDDQIAIGIMHEVSKDRRAAQIRAERQAMLREYGSKPSGDAEGEQRASREAKNRAASSKQIEYLRKLGVQPTVNMSSFEASQAIDEALARRHIEA